MMAALQTMDFDRRLPFTELLLELFAIMLVGTTSGMALATMIWGAMQVARLKPKSLFAGLSVKVATI